LDVKSTRQFWFCVAAAVALHFFAFVLFNKGLTFSSSGHSIPSKALTTRLVSPSTAKESQPKEIVRLASLETPLPNQVINEPSTVSPNISNPVAVAPSIQSVLRYPGGLLNREHEYLLAGDLDETAMPSEDLGTVLARIFPVLSGLIVLDLWIDATGQVVRVDLVQGRTLLREVDAMQPLLEVKFQPAIKNGQSVASRKLIEIDTDIVPSL
jgi:hypothetical protein